MDTVLEHIIKDPKLHLRWLATLSELELCGARKIASYLPKNSQEKNSWAEDLELLQHAAEEFRHAHFFKKQMAKLNAEPKLSRRLCGRRGARYLHILDLEIARYLRKKDANIELHKACYLLTTYAIEVRARNIYGRYEVLLRAMNSPVSVRSILAEELGHLRQIEDSLAKNPMLDRAKEDVCRLEEKIFEQFWKELQNEITLTLHSAPASFALS